MIRITKVTRAFSRVHTFAGAQQSPLLTIKQTAGKIISPSTYVHICTLFVSFAVFIYYFNCISFAIRLLGCTVAIKLTDCLKTYIRHGCGLATTEP